MGGGTAYLWEWMRERGCLCVKAFTATQKDVVYQHIECSKFRFVEGLLLPRRVEETDWEPLGKHAMMHHAVLTNIQYRIGAKSNTANSYYIVFPKGAGVLDERINQQFNVESGPRRLTDKGKM